MMSATLSTEAPSPAQISQASSTIVARELRLLIRERGEQMPRGSFGRRLSIAMQDLFLEPLPKSLTASLDPQTGTLTVAVVEQDLVFSVSMKGKAA